MERNELIEAPFKLNREDIKEEYIMKILSKVKRVLKKASVLILSMSLFLGLSFSQAEEIAGKLGSNLGLNLGIKIEAVLNEGTQVELSQEQISEMLPWAKNSKIFLEDLLENVAGLRKAEQLQQLKAVIRDVVLQSAPKKTELLMRYVLNRSMMLVDVISNESVSGDRGIMNNQLRLLKRSVEMALGYYKSDLSYLNGEDDSADRVSFAVFGLEYSVFLADLGNSILDASAQYKVIRMRLGFLQNSLYRDQNNKVFATSIISLNNALKANPEDVEASDQNYLERIRQLKRVYKKQKNHIMQGLKRAGAQVRKERWKERGVSSNVLQALFVKVDPGRFQMGSSIREKGHFEDETQHEEILKKGFEMQATEVTQEQWFQVMGDSPSYFNKKTYCEDSFKDVDRTPRCPQHPVENISWNHVQDFIKELNKLSSTHIYRLPTEAEWEYAARAGTKTPFNLGGDISPERVNYNGDKPYKGVKGLNRKQTVAVASLDNANSWGLYDMHGNVWEWVQDWGSYEWYRVLRGGGWPNPAWRVRSAARTNREKGSIHRAVGFRLVRTAK